MRRLLTASSPISEDKEASLNAEQVRIAENDRLQKEAEGLGANLSRINASIEEASERAETEIEEKRREVESEKARLDSDIVAKRKEFEEVTAENVVAKNHNETLVREKNRLSGHIDLMKNELADLEARGARERRVADEAKAELTQTSRETDKMRADLSELKAETDKVEKRKNEAAAEAVDAEKRRDAAVEELDSTNADLRVAQKELAQVRLESTEKNGELEAARKEIQQIRSEALTTKTTQDAREVALSKQAGEVAKLVEYADQKLDMINQAKSAFTTQQLLRMGLEPGSSE